MADGPFRDAGKTTAVPNNPLQTNSFLSMGFRRLDSIMSEAVCRRPRRAHASRDGARSRRRGMVLDLAVKTHFAGRGYVSLRR